MAAAPDQIVVLGGNVAPLEEYGSVPGPIAIGTTVTALWTVTVPALGVGGFPTWHVNEGAAFANTGAAVATVNFTLAVNGGTPGTLASKILGASGAAGSLELFSYEVFATINTNQVNTYQFGASASVTGVNFTGAGPGFVFAFIGGPL